MDLERALPAQLARSKVEADRRGTRLHLDLRRRSGLSNESDVDPIARFPDDFEAVDFTLRRYRTAHSRFREGGRQPTSRACRHEGLREDDIRRPGSCDGKLRISKPKIRLRRSTDGRIGIWTAHSRRQLGPRRIPLWRSSRCDARRGEGVYPWRRRNQTPYKQLQSDDSQCDDSIHHETPLPRPVWRPDCSENEARLLRPRTSDVYRIRVAPDVCSAARIAADLPGGTGAAA